MPPSVGGWVVLGGRGKKKEGGTETILRRVVRTDRYFTRCLVRKRRLGLFMFLALDPGINVACISILFVG